MKSWHIITCGCHKRKELKPTLLNQFVMFSSCQFPICPRLISALTSFPRDALDSNSSIKCTNLIRKKMPNDSFPSTSPTGHLFFAVLCSLSLPIPTQRTVCCTAEEIAKNKPANPRLLKKQTQRENMECRPLCGGCSFPSGTCKIGKAAFNLLPFSASCHLQI